MTSLEQQSPPRRRKRPIGSSIVNATHQSLISLPSLATIFHGLPPAQSRQQQSTSTIKTKAPDPTKEVQQDSRTSTKREPRPAVSRPPTRVQAPAPPSHSPATADRSAETETEQPVPQAFAPPAPTRLHKSDESSPALVRPIPRRGSAHSRSGTEGEALAEKRRTNSAHWAARILSPIVRKEQEQASRSGHRRLRSSRSSRSSRRRVIESDEESNDDELPLSVDAFLAAAVPRAVRSAKRQYGSSKKKRRGDGSSSTSKSRSSTRKTRSRATVRDYSSDTDDEEQDLQASEWEDPLPRRSARNLSAPKPRRLRPLPRFAGASGEERGRVKAPYEYQHRPRELELDRASQLEEEEEYGRVLNKKDRRVKRVEPGKGHAAFLASLNDTAFVRPAADKAGERLGDSPGPGEVEGVAELDDGQQRITSRVFSPSEIARLDTYEEIRGVKRRKLANGRVSRFPALEMRAIGEEDFAPPQDDEDPFFAAQKAAMAELSFVNRDRPSAQDRPPTPLRQPQPKKLPVAKPLHFSIAEQPSREPAHPQGQRDSADSPSTTKRANFAAATDQMQQSFDRRAKKPTTLVPNTISTAHHTASSLPPAPAFEIPATNSAAEEEEGEAEIDPIALLPTPRPPSFRFVTGPRIVPKKLELVEEEQPYRLSPREDETPAPLDFVTEEEYEAERELERAMDDEWDPWMWGTGPWRAEHREESNNGEQGQAVRQEDEEPTFDFRLDSQREDSPNPIIRSSSPAGRLKRRVTFSSPLAPCPSKVKQRRATTSQAVPRKAALVRRTQSKSPARLDRRAQTLGATPRKLPPTSIAMGSHSRRASSSGKLLRRLSTTPAFRLPSSPSRDSPRPTKLDFEAEQDDQSARESSHEYISTLRDRLGVEDTEDRPSLELPPAAQPHSEAQPSPHDAASAPPSPSHGSSVNFRQYGVPSIDYLALVVEDVQEPSVNELVDAAEKEGEEDDHDEQDGVRGSELTEQYTGDDLWDDLLTIQPDLIAGPHLGPNSSPVQPQPPSPRLSPHFIPSDPTAVVSLPSSFFSGGKAAPKPRRARTVWGGVPLSGLGRVGLTELVAMRG